MAIRVQASFAAGEIDPALHDRTTLQTFDSGLTTAKNIVIGRTGRIVSRAGREYFGKAKNNNQKIVIFQAPDSDLVFEFGPLYIRVYTDEVFRDDVNNVTYQAGALLYEYTTSYSEDILKYLQFEIGYQNAQNSGPGGTNGFDGTFLYVFNRFSRVRKYPLNPYSVLSGLEVAATDLFALPSTPLAVVTATNSTGYDVDYVVTRVTDKGEESLPLMVASALKFPNGSGQKNDLDVKVAISPFTTNTLAVNIYRRPKDVGEYGFVGSAATSHLISGDTYFFFSDIGGEADYDHSPPAPAFDKPSSLYQLTDNLPNTGIVYQQRLIQTINGGEGIIASRTGRYNNFYRDFPLASDGGLQFRAGAGGAARVLRFVENDGLIAFTTLGIYSNTGVLNNQNFALTKKGKYIIDEFVPVLSIPGAVVFLDKATNSLRSLNFSLEGNTYTASDLSAFSAHLFQGRKVTSLAFEEGDIPVLIATFNDGTYATLTYEKEQQMRAWTRHDSDPRILVEQAQSSSKPNRSYYVVNRGGQRYIERSVPRFPLISEILTNAQTEIGKVAAAMDSFKTFQIVVNDSLLPGQVMNLVPVTPNDWEGPLTLTCGSSNIFTIGTYPVGTIFRHFDGDLATTDLEITARASNNSVTVQPVSEFPPEFAAAVKLYKTFTSVSGLDHLELEYPAVKVDGAILASPNNDYETYDAPRVMSGVLTLPAGRRAAIMHVGRPITFDTETLDVATVEQRPTLIESKILNKLYIRVLKSRGLFVGSKFPANNKVEGMEDADTDYVNYDENEDGAVLGNVYRKPLSRRIEVNIQGRWESQGRACIRQVDADHFEILSIIPDLEDERR